MKRLGCFFLDVFIEGITGSKRYHAWMGALTFLMICGAYAYTIQYRDGLVVTNMNDHVSWGFYISNFTFLVGLAAAAVMLVIPCYVLKDIDFNKAVLIGEGVAVAAIFMCLMFVTVDLGGPEKFWHLMPMLGTLNFPESLLAWDVIVLNGYLVLNIMIPFYILYSHYNKKEAKKKWYLPFVYLSVFWAVSIHMVTAFLLAGLPARPYWNNSLLGPRFLASAFAAGPACLIIIMSFIRRYSDYEIKTATLDKLAMITTVAAQINLIMLGSELFKEFYWPTHHSLSAHYLFFGLHGHNALVPWIWVSILVNLIATIVLTIHPLRKTPAVLNLTCILLFVAIWMEKGIGLIVPGFIPSPLGEIVEYVPSKIELIVSIGIWAMGLFIFTILAKAAIAIEGGKLTYDSK